MKNLFIAIVLFLSVNVSSAQDAAFKEDVLRVIKLSGSTGMMDVAKKQILGMVPQAKQAAFLVEFEATMPALYDKFAAVYMKEYTHDEIKAILKFYETPIGKKMAEKAAPIYEQSLASSQEWAQGLQAMMMKYMQ